MGFKNAVENLGRPAAVELRGAGGTWQAVKTICDASQGRPAGWVLVRPRGGPARWVRRYVLLGARP
jgi:hypothetical protein